MTKCEESGESIYLVVTEEGDFKGLCENLKKNHPKLIIEDCG